LIPTGHKHNTITHTTSISQPSGILQLPEQQLHLLDTHRQEHPTRQVYTGALLFGLDLAGTVCLHLGSNFGTWLNIAAHMHAFRTANKNKEKYDIADLEEGKLNIKTGQHKFFVLSPK